MSFDDFYGGEGGGGWNAVMGGQADDSGDDSLASRVKKFGSDALKGLSKPSSGSSAPMPGAVQAPPPPAPYTPDTSGIQEMGSQMSPRVQRNPRLQQAMLEA